MATPGGGGADPAPPGTPGEDAGSSSAAVVHVAPLYWVFPWENHGKTTGKTWEMHGNIGGKYGKCMGKHDKYGKLWETDGKSMDK